MTTASSARKPWAPPSDEELTWFLPGGVFPLSPLPLEYTGEIHARVFGMSNALDSLSFALYTVRSRMTQRRLYLAVVPSALAERNLPLRMERLRDASLRFTRNIGDAWVHGPRQEAEGYNRWMAEFPAGAESGRAWSEQVRQLRRVRGNQWYAVIRAVIAPAAMLQAGVEGSTPEQAMVVVKQALDVVADQGAAHFQAAIGRVGQRIADDGCIDFSDDLKWMEWPEVREALEHPSPRQSLVAKRRTDATGPDGSPPSLLGPPLPADAPRMHLIREILALLG